MTEKKLAQDRLAQLLSVAKQRFGFSAPVSLLFNLKGQACGQARINHRKQCLIRINPEALEQHTDYVLNQTLAHELAHLVGFYSGKDRGHGPFWKQVCVSLGGQAKRCHNLPLTPARKQQRYRVTASCGTELEISSTRFNRIQKGVVYTLKTGGTLHRQCRWEAVS